MAVKGKRARTAESQPLVYSLTELAVRLGLREQQVKRMINRGEGPPPIKLGHGLVFRHSSVERWLVQCEREAAETMKRNQALVKKFAG